MNLWLLRNQIGNYKRLIEEYLEPSEYPDIYYRELPPEMPMDYMANNRVLIGSKKGSVNPAAEAVAPVMPKLERMEQMTLFGGII